MIEGKIVDQAGCFENTLALPQRGKASSVSGFALLSCVEEPCPLSLQTVFSITQPDLLFITEYVMLPTLTNLHLISTYFTKMSSF